FEAGHQTPDDRIGGSVLVVGVAGRNRVAVPPALAGVPLLSGRGHRGLWRAPGTARALSALFLIASPNVASSSTSAVAVGRSAASSDGSAGATLLARGSCPGS